MAELILKYFDFNGGRGEATRLIMHIGNIAFTDERFHFSEFGEVRKTTPLNQVPTLSIDGRVVTQSNAINRYVGKIAGLYPEDNMQALLCDEVLDAVEDITHKMVSSFGMEGEELKQAREAFISGPITRYCQWMEKVLSNNGGEFFADNRLTIADIKAFVLLRGFSSGQLDHIPTDCVQTISPAMASYCERIGQTPAIVEYYANH